MDLIYDLWNNNHHIVPLTLLVLAGIFFLSLRHSKQQRKDYVEPPFPSKLGPFETMKTLTSQDLPYKLLEWAQDTGFIFQLKMPLAPYPMFVVSGDIDLCKEVLNDRTSLKSKGVDTLKLLHDGGDDIFTSDGLFWKHSRKGIAPAFSSNHIKRMNHVVIRETEKFMKTLDKLAIEGKSFDVGHEMLILTLSVISEAGFQYSMSLDEKMMFLDELDIVFAEMLKGRMPFRWTFGSFIPEVRRAKEAGKNLVAFGMKVLEHYRQLESPLEGTVIDLIARNNNYKDDKERASDILVLFVGGHDTTAFTLVRILVELAKNQHEQLQLQNELKSLPENDRLSSVALHCVIKEGQRLRPVVLGPSRMLTRDVIVKKTDENGLEKDMLIPSGSAVLCPSKLLNSNPKYHQDADLFKPSRWINPSPQASASLIPFALGRRRCIGQTLAEAEIVNVLSRLCADYTFIVEAEGKEKLLLTHQIIGARLLVSKAVEEPTK